MLTPWAPSFAEYQENSQSQNSLEAVITSGSRSCGVIGKVVNVTADDSVLVNGQLDMSLVNAISFDTYTHGYYKVTERVGEAFQEGLKLKK